MLREFELDMPAELGDAEPSGREGPWPAAPTCWSTCASGAKSSADLGLRAHNHVRHGHATSPQRTAPCNIGSFTLAATLTPPGDGRRPHHPWSRAPAFSAARWCAIRRSCRLSAAPARRRRTPHRCSTGARCGCRLPPASARCPHPALDESIHRLQEEPAQAGRAGGGTGLSWPGPAANGEPLLQDWRGARATHHRRRCRGEEGPRRRPRTDARMRRLGAVAPTRRGERGGVPS